MSVRGALIDEPTASVNLEGKGGGDSDEAHDSIEGEEKTCN